MTQQYLVGHLSLLLEDLERGAPRWQPTVHDLRREIELAPPEGLPRLARDAIELSDAICWATLQDGDALRFVTCASAARAIAQFIDSAQLGHLP